MISKFPHKSKKLNLFRSSVINLFAVTFTLLLMFFILISITVTAKAGQKLLFISNNANPNIPDSLIQNYDKIEIMVGSHLDVSSFKNAISLADMVVFDSGTYTFAGKLINIDNPCTISAIRSGARLIIDSESSTDPELIELYGLQNDGDAEVVVYQQPLYVDESTIWNTRNIPVCWENPSSKDAAERGWVQDAINKSWGSYGLVDFTGWGKCSDNDVDGIRILIDDDGPHTKGLGATNLKGKEDGMVLNFTFNEWPSKDYSKKLTASARESDIRIIAVHEFGHALGFAHEHNRSVPCWCDKEPQGSDGNLTIGAWDINSVMNYCNQTWGNAGVLSTGDELGFKAMYGYRTLLVGGNEWGSDAYVTSITFGDVDGDGLDEVGVTRWHKSNSRYWVFDDALSLHKLLFKHENPNNWGDDRYATSIAFGDVDGDGRDEVGISRNSGSNWRVAIYDDALAGFKTLKTFGTGWGDSYGCQSLTFGDVDGDGLDEVLFTRFDSRIYGKDHRIYVQDDLVAGFKELFVKEPDIGFPEKIACGDLDGDGKDEIAVCINTQNKKDVRLLVLDDFQSGFKSIWNGGKKWGSGRLATSVSFGDIDGDGRDELGVTRNKGSNWRWSIYSYLGGSWKSNGGNQGSGWGESYGATGISFGDVDGDGLDEVGISRDARDVSIDWPILNDPRAIRFWIIDYNNGSFTNLTGGGSGWGDDRFSTCIGFGDVDGDGDSDFGVGRNEGENHRFILRESDW